MEQMPKNIPALGGNRLAAAALATLGAASAIPIPLAQLDFAGLINVFQIDNGDSPQALLVIAGVGGVLTFGVLALAFAGAFLAATGARSARVTLIAAALAGLVTALPLWIPAGVLIGAAAAVLGMPAAADANRARNLPRVSGVQTRTCRQGEV
jgi:ABC-type siderophore export system fused ATPase/permease subunit